MHIRERNKTGEYLVVDSLEALLGVVQGDVLELHVWNAVVDDIERPDRVVFDLDPAPDVPWSSVVAAAFVLRDRLAARGLRAFPRLTGGKGLHVVVPLVPSAGWDVVYEFSRTLAASIVRAEPGRFTTRFAKEGRAGKILVDYKRNHRAATTVASYSVRANPDGAVVTPVAWTELPGLRGPDAFTVMNLRERLGSLRRDPWDGFWSCRQTLSSRVSSRKN